MREAVIVEAVRTPIARGKVGVGDLHGFHSVELLGLSGETPGPEMTLISDSVAGASAKVKFLRVAFGHSAPDQMMSAAEVRFLLSLLFIHDSLH